MNLIEDLGPPFSYVEDALFSHVFEQCALFDQPQYLGNRGGNGFPAADFVGHLYHRVGVAATTEFLVAFCPEGVDGSDLGLRQVGVSVNFGVTRTGEPHLDRLRIDERALELVIDKPGGCAGEVTGIPR